MVGDKAQQVVPDALRGGQGLLVAGREEHLGPGPSPKAPLCRREPLGREDALHQGLHEIHGLEGVSRVEVDRVLDDQQVLHSAYRRIVDRVRRILLEPDDAWDHPAIALPDVDAVDGGRVPELDQPLQLRRVPGEEHDGDSGADLPGAAPEFREVHVAEPHQADHQIVPGRLQLREGSLPARDLLQARDAAPGPAEGRQQEVVEPPVLLEDEVVVKAGYEQHAADADRREGGEE